MPAIQNTVQPHTEIPATENTSAAVQSDEERKTPNPTPSSAALASVVTKIGGFLGLLSAFILWKVIIGGVTGLIIALVAVPFLSVFFMFLLSLLFGATSVLFLRNE